MRVIANCKAGRNSSKKVRQSRSIYESQQWMDLPIGVMGTYPPKGGCSPTHHVSNHRQTWATRRSKSCFPPTCHGKETTHVSEPDHSLRVTLSFRGMVATVKRSKASFFL